RWGGGGGGGGGVGGAGAGPGARAGCRVPAPPVEVPVPSLTGPAEGSDPSSVVQLDPPPAVESLGRVREYHRSIVGRLGLAPQPSARLSWLRPGPHRHRRTARSR